MLTNGGKEITISPTSETENETEKGNDEKSSKRMPFQRVSGWWKGNRDRFVKMVSEPQGRAKGLDHDGNARYSVRV